MAVVLSPSPITDASPATVSTGTAPRDAGSLDASLAERATTDPVPDRRPGSARAAEREGVPPRPGRLAALDGLRLVAAIMVVLYHYTYRAPDVWGERTTRVFPTASALTGYGWLGVQLFFVISGFVICMTAWDRRLGEFFVSRATRLYPAYWFGILATVCVLAFLRPEAPGTQPGTRPGDLLVNLTMLQTPMRVPDADGVYWTLWAELHFYLLFAIVVWRGVTYRRVVQFCLLWTVASVVVAGASDPTVNLVVGPDESPYFIAGVALYLMYRYRPTLLLWGIVGFSWALGAYRLRATVDHVNEIGERNLPVAGAVILLTAIFAVMVAIALGRLSWVRGAWLSTAGLLTYPLYLLHQQIGWAVIARLHDRIPPWTLTISLITALVVVSLLVHRLVERPAAGHVRRLLDHAVDQMRQYPAVPAVADTRRVAAGHPVPLAAAGVAAASESGP